MGATARFIVPPALLNDIEIQHNGNDLSTFETTMFLRMHKYGVPVTFDISTMYAHDEKSDNENLRNGQTVLIASYSGLSRNAVKRCDDIINMGIPCTHDATTYRTTGKEEENHKVIEDKEYEIHNCYDFDVQILELQHVLTLQRSGYHYPEDSEDTPEKVSYKRIELDKRWR